MPQRFDFWHLRVHFGPIGDDFDLCETFFDRWKSIVGSVQLSASESRLRAPKSSTLARLVSHFFTQKVRFGPLGVDFEPLEVDIYPL